MRLSLGQLRRLVRETVGDCWGGSHPEEMYEQEASSDPTWKKRSAYVPDDIKKSIKTWSRAMGLSGKRKKHARRT